MEARAIKKFEDLTIQDDFMFYKIMQNKKFCKRMLEIILQDKIGEITELYQQKIINNTYCAKGVRFDVLAKDDRETLYNIEMQMTHEKDLLHRLRYYQGSIDVASLSIGQDYNELLKTIIIFLCNGDILGNGLPISTIRKRYDENEYIAQDGTTHIVINYSLDYLIENEELRALCRYCKTKEVTNEFTKEVDNMVEGVKLNAEARGEYHFLANRYPDFMLRALKEGKAEGKAEGIAEGIQQGILQGITKGRAEGICETARNMKANNCDEAFIAEMTGLTIEEIERL